MYTPNLLLSSVLTTTALAAVAPPTTVAAPAPTAAPLVGRAAVQDDCDAKAKQPGLAFGPVRLPSAISKTLSSASVTNPCDAAAASAALPTGLTSQYDAWLGTVSAWHAGSMATCLGYDVAMAALPTGCAEQFGGGGGDGAAAGSSGSTIPSRPPVGSGFDRKQWEDAWSECAAAALTVGLLLGPDREVGSREDLPPACARLLQTAQGKAVDGQDKKEGKKSGGVAGTAPRLAAAVVAAALAIVTAANV